MRDIIIYLDVQVAGNIRPQVALNSIVEDLRARAAADGDGVRARQAARVISGAGHGGGSHSGVGRAQVGQHQRRNVAARRQRRPRVRPRRRRRHLRRVEHVGVGQHAAADVARIGHARYGQPHVGGVDRHGGGAVEERKAGRRGDVDPVNHQQLVYIATCEGQVRIGGTGQVVVGWGAHGAGSVDLAAAEVG